MPKYYTVSEVAAIFRREPRTIRRWIADGTLSARKVKDGYLIPEKTVDRLLKTA